MSNETNDIAKDIAQGIGAAAKTAGKLFSEAAASQNGSKNASAARDEGDARGSSGEPSEIIPMSENAEIISQSSADEYRRILAENESAIQKIQNNNYTPAYSYVSETGKVLFFTYDKDAKASDLNSAMRESQRIFSQQSGQISQLADSVATVGKVINMLDREYIKTFIAQFKLIKGNIRDLEEHRKRIDENFERTGKIVNILKSHKDKLDKLEHLENVDELWRRVNSISTDPDIVRRSDRTFATLSSLNHISGVDEMWSDVSGIKSWKDTLQQNILPSVHSQLKNAAKEAELLKEKLGDEKELVRRNEEQYSGLLSFKDRLDGFRHIGDIDALWERSAETQTRLGGAVALINAHKVPIGILTDFKNSLEEQEHLRDIDIIWSRCDVSDERLEAAEKNISDNKISVSELGENFGSFKSSLEEHEHLHDIDALWSRCDESDERLEAAEKNISENKAYVSELGENFGSFKNSLEEQEHLRDIDALWSRCDESDGRLEAAENGIAENKASVSELGENFGSFKSSLEEQEHLRDIDALWSRCDESNGRLEGVEGEAKSNSESITALEAKIAGLADDMNETNMTLRKRLKLAYYLIGGTFAISAVELILLITRLI